MKVFAFKIERCGKLSFPHLELQIYLIIKEWFLLNNTLSHHSFGYFHESCYISTFHIVYITVCFSTILYTSLMNIFHDTFQFFIYFFLTPA